MKLGIDIDGVVADFVSTFCTEHHKWHASNVLPKDVRIWDFHKKMFKLDFEGMMAFCREAAVFQKCELVPGALGGLYELAKKNEIVFVTARPDWAAEATDDWIVGNIWRRSFDYKLVITQHKESADCDLYLDDSPEVIKALADSGNRVVRYIKPWNRTLVRGDIMSVDSWAQFTRLVRGLKDVEAIANPVAGEVEPSAGQDG